MKYIRQVVLVASLLAASPVSASCLHGTSFMPRRVENGRVEVSDFSYTGGETGPLNWAGIKPENRACATASVQSPINLDQSIALAQVKPRLQINSVEAAEFENLGTTVEVIVNGSTFVGESEFLLQQFHFHTPSEHRIGDEYFPAEMHMVHEAADGSGALAVIAVLFELSEDGSTTDLLTNVVENIDNIAEPGTVTETGPLVFDQLVNHVQTVPLFQYTGSLTTPPCAEGLVFFVTSVPMPINVQTFRALKKVVKFNSRYTQNKLGEKNLVLVAGANQEVSATICEGAALNLVSGSGAVGQHEGMATEASIGTHATETATEAANETAEAEPTEASGSNWLGEAERHCRHMCHKRRAPNCLGNC